MAFLRTGRAALPTKRSLRKTGVKDLERGLSVKLRIEHYTSNRVTKDFLVEQAQRLAPALREKSGVRYRLNRWREEQITSGKHPTYGSLVRQYIALNKMERFEKIPHVRYINFLAEFLAEQKGATRADAIAAWTELKQLDAPKTYASWVKGASEAQGRKQVTSHDDAKGHHSAGLRRLQPAQHRLCLSAHDRRRELAQSLRGRQSCRKRRDPRLLDSTMG